MSISKLPTSASLKEVIDKFEEISLADFSNIDIIVRSELPSNGKEGQICVLSSINPNNIIISRYEDDFIKNETDIFVQIDSIKSYAQQFEVKGNNKKIYMYIDAIFQVVDGVLERLSSKIYKDGSWQDLTDTGFYAFDGGAYKNIDFFGKLNNAGDANSAIITDTHLLQLKRSTSYATTGSTWTFANTIDVSKYKTLEIAVDSTSNLRGEEYYFEFGIHGNGANSAIPTFKASNRVSNVKIESLTKYTCDISNIKSGRLGIMLAMGGLHYINIKSITLY